MKQLLFLVWILLFGSNCLAEEAVDSSASGGADQADQNDEGVLDQFLDTFDANPFDFRGWTPRYAYVDDDNIIGHTHYFGVGYYVRNGAAHEGPTLRAGVGTRGDKLNLTYTDGFSFMHVDFGLSYYFLDDDNPRAVNEVESLALELGLRFWVIQFIGVHTEETSFVSLAYGF